MPSIHPTACVERAAEIAEDVEIGPYCIVGPHVTIGPGCRLLAHVHVTGHTSLGAGTTIYPFVSLGTPPQSIRYRVGREVMFANGATLGGHCIVGDHVFIGGLSAVHQFSRIGSHAMIAGLTGVRADIIPFGFVIGSVGQLAGLNVIGMKRRKFSRDSIHAVRKAYRMLFFDEGTFASRIDLVEAELGADAAVAAILAFVREGGSRPLCHPGGGYRG